MIKQAVFIGSLLAAVALAVPPLSDHAGRSMDILYPQIDNFAENKLKLPPPINMSMADDIVE